MPTQRNRQEIIDMLSQCGTLSYNEFVDLLYSIPFLLEIEDGEFDQFISRFTGVWDSSMATAGKYDVGYFASYQNSIYKSILENNNDVPGTTSNWVLQTDGIASLGYRGNTYPTDPAITPTEGIFFTASEAGTYVNKGGVVLPEDSQGFISWTATSGWTISYFTSSLLRKSIGLVAINGGSINIDTAAETITTVTGANQMFVYQGDTFLPVVAAVEGITTIGGAKNGLVYILYRKSTQRIGLYFFNRVPEFIADSIVLGIVFSFSTAPTLARLSTASDITINGVPKYAPGNILPGRNYDKIGTISALEAAYTLNIDYTAKTITYTQTGVVTIARGGFFWTPAAGHSTPFVDTRVDSSIGAGLNYIVFNTTDSKFYVYNYTRQSEIRAENFVLLGTFYGNAATVPEMVQTLEASGKITINGLEKTYKPSTVLAEKQYDKIGAVIGTGDFKIKIDTGAKTITFEPVGTQIFIVFGADYYPRPTTNLTEAIQTTASYAGIFFIYYQISTAKFRCFHFSKQADAKNTDHILMGWFYDLNNVSYLQTVTLTKQIYFNNIQISQFAPYVPPTVTAPYPEIIAPAKIWMLTGQNLPLYKTSLLRLLTDYPNELILQNYADSDTDFNYPTFETIFSDIMLDPAKLKSSIRISSKNYSTLTADYGVDISIIKSAANAKTGLNKVWWCWGDSLTNRGAFKFTRAYLASISSGLVVTPNGTIQNSGFAGEGREGWTFLNFIGADNLHLNSTVITRLPDGEGVATLYQNPFLRLATSDDYTAHPTWCFRNTGSNNELSYQSDPVKTGDFYIFDPLYYKNQHITGSVPDLITIALSTNDITEYSAAGVTNSLFGIEVMLTQIKAAFPSVKVGIIPATGRGDNAQAAWGITCDWINQLNNKIASLPTDVKSNVDIIGVWLHMNKSFIYPYTGTSNLKSDGNLTKTFTKGESIHFDRNGYLAYAKALGAYVVNVV